MRRLNLLLISFLMVFSSVSHSEIRSSLQAQSLSFLSPDYTADNKNFSFIGAHVRTIRNPDIKTQNVGETKIQVIKAEQDAFNIDLDAAYAMGNSVLSFMNFQEVFYTYKIDDVSAIHMGRKLSDWSALDSLFNFGVYQPQFNWNKLDPKSQGLTGFFWSKNEQSYNLTLFATPLYIPDQGASYEIKDGQFQSGNPFFQPPPQNIKFQGQLLPIDYDIHRPETTDVIFQTQLGAQVHFGESTGYFANVAAIFKPSNQLALGYKGVLVTTRVRVDVTPKTYLENVYSADTGYRGDWGHFILSALYTKAQNPEFDSTYNAPTFEPSLMFGPQFLFKFKPFDFFAAYVDTSGGKVTDVGPDASADRASLSERFLFKQAAVVGIGYSDIYFKQVKINSNFQYKFSSKEGYRQIRFKNMVNLRGPWAFWVDVLLIDTDSNIQSGYESYKNLDQVWVGASYDI